MGTGPGRREREETKRIRKLPPYEQTIGAVLVGAKEAIVAPMRPKRQEYDITEPQWRVLRVINDRGATDATDIAEAGFLRPPSVTRILKELEERKYVVREPDANDRRRNLVSLSPKGREMVHIISGHVVHIMREYSDRFGARRLERLIDELRALSTAIKNVE